MWFCCSSVFGFPCSKTSYNWIYRQCCQKSHSRAQKLVTNFQHITYQLPSMGKIRLFTPSHVCSLPAAGLHLIVIQYLLSVAMELGTGPSANNDLLYTPLASTSPLAKHKGTEREWDDSDREWDDSPVCVPLSLGLKGAWFAQENAGERTPFPIFLHLEVLYWEQLFIKLF